MLLSSSLVFEIPKDTQNQSNFLHSTFKTKPEQLRTFIHFYPIKGKLTACLYFLCCLGNSPTLGAGQQCCYDHAGAQVLTSDSIGGSTPDRGHDWGSPPFRKPPRVPGQSHWVYDVLSFYYCCLWSDNCHYYFKHRPSSDCRNYTTPSSGELAQRHVTNSAHLSFN